MTNSLKGRAVQILPSVVVLALEDGTTGLLPRREFVPRTRRDLRQVVSLDQEFSVMVEGAIPDTTGRFWVRLASEDLWARAPVEFAPGALVTGAVRGVESFGIFVDLLPGITGLVPREEMSALSLLRPEQVVWVGDIVKCQALAVNVQQQRVTLSMRAASLGRSQDLETGSANDVASAPTREIKAQLDSPRAGEITPLKIFLVDNEIALRDHFAEHLRQASHVVEVANSARSAAARLRDESFDLIVLDINLGDGNGLDLAKQLLTWEAHPRIVLMTDWIRAGALAQDLASLFEQGVDLISKPNHAQELDELLQDDHADPPAPQRRSRRARLQAQAPSRANLERASTLVLSELQEQTQASHIAVFSLDPLTQQLLILAAQGNLKLDDAELLAHWRYSPVRDVLQDGDTVREKDARDERRGARFRYLLNVLDFRSCIGVPVLAEIPTALFLFHREADRFGHAHFQFARAAAERLAAALDRHAMEKALVETQRFALLGQLGAVVVHEINNKLGLLNWDARLLPDDLLKIEQGMEGSRSQTTRQLLTKSLERSRALRAAAAELVKLTTSFDNLIRHQDTTRLNVHDLINQTIAISAPYAEDANVVCRVRFEHPAPFVTGIAVRLQQVLLNVVLNAIQQIQERDAQSGGHVLVTTRASQNATRRAIEIRVLDDGPGIHTAYLGRVFDLGFTTRAKGSGIGLFITRWLVESLGGTVSVEASHVLWGTTLLIQLPLAESGGGSG